MPIIVNSTFAFCTLPVTGAAPGSWNVTATNPDGQLETRVHAFTISPAPDMPARIGVWRNSNTWLLDGSGNRAFGKTGDIPVTGDWNGDARDEIGVFRDNTTWIPDYSGNGTYGSGDLVFTFRMTRDIPVTGRLARNRNSIN